MNLEIKQDKGKRKTIYISGPITGIDDYLSKFAKADSYWRFKIVSRTTDYTSIINPAFTNITLPNDFEHQDYMTVCFTLMDLCDGIYLLDGWKNSVGATMEYTYAKKKGMEIFYEEISKECMSLDC